MAAGSKRTSAFITLNTMLIIFKTAVIILITPFNSFNIDSKKITT